MCFYTNLQYLRNKIKVYKCDIDNKYCNSRATRSNELLQCFIFRPEASLFVPDVSEAS